MWSDHFNEHSKREKQGEYIFAMIHGFLKKCVIPADSVSAVSFLSIVQVCQAEISLKVGIYNSNKDNVV